MRIFIMTDLEGAAMVTRFNQTRNPTPEAKAIAMRFLTDEINACIDGIREVDADAEIIVWDGHGSGGVDITRLHPECKFIARGPIDPPYYIDKSVDALFFVGQHAMAGTPQGNLAHTYSSLSIEYFKLNGKPIGELGCRAAMAGELDVPSVFVSGDDKTIAEAKALIPDIVGAVTKKGLGLELALSLSSDKSCKLIREKATDAVMKIGTIPPCRIKGPYELEIKVTPGHDPSGYLKGQEGIRLDELTVLLKSDSLIKLPI